jgi:hypothetical protein
MGFTQPIGLKNSFDRGSVSARYIEDGFATLDSMTDKLRLFL